MFPQSIVTADIITVDYDSAKFLVDGKNGQEEVAVRFFCTILVRGGFMFRHTSNLFDEITASNVTEKIYTHVFKDKGIVNMKFWQEYRSVHTTPLLEEMQLEAHLDTV
jgi:hypothetical protein